MEHASASRRDVRNLRIRRNDIHNLIEIGRDGGGERLSGDFRYFRHKRRFRQFDSDAGLVATPVF